ncbi:beta-lactamase [Caballeronia mineralivorans PML1(12)]|uniref:Beta-lactamase n=1 Tax=Caballeronia mineralivorans PML1(12) TaxID=908627 RepID=A0A0J1CYA8_9BURK|nr:serine hydrolase domain-containing protein [Caballeronia mineralivorans]KLU25520.1 beta-lactamase [Caballeronia mineralivorans PML1(12)]
MSDAGFSATRLERTRTAMQQFVETGDVAGCVTLVWRHGEIARVDMLGHSDSETRTPMMRGTLFRIASMTKPVTSLAALMLVEEGRIALDDPVSRWLPELANPKVLTDPVASLDRTEPARAPITLLDLLTHRAGFAYHFSAFGALADAYGNVFNGVEASVDPGAWLQRVADLPLMFQPGARWHYGISTDVLGALIQRISGVSLEAFFRTRIFEPLEMNDTGFVVPLEKLGRLSVAYAVDPVTQQRVVEDHPASSRFAKPERFQSGGGGLVSTADDYLRFARLLLGRGRMQGNADERARGPRLLSHRSVDLMRTNFLSRDQRRIPAFGQIVWAGQGFGLGLAIVDDPAQQRTLGYRSTGSFGWPGALGTSWFADPVENMIGIMLIQRRSVEPFPMAAAFERHLYDAIDD